MGPNMSRLTTGEKDWKDENDPRKRRQLQNRANQRACRQRKREGQKTPLQVRRSARQTGVAPVDDASITVANSVQDDQHGRAHPSRPSAMDDVHRADDDDQEGPSQRHMSTRSPSELLAGESSQPADFSFTTALTTDPPGNYLSSRSS